MKIYPYVNTTRANKDGSFPGSIVGKDFAYRRGNWAAFAKINQSFLHGCGWLENVLKCFYTPIGRQSL